MFGDYLNPCLMHCPTNSAKAWKAKMFKAFTTANLVAGTAFNCSRAPA